MCEFHEPEWKFNPGDEVECDGWKSWYNQDISPQSQKNEQVICRGTVVDTVHVPGSGAYYAYKINMTHPEKFYATVWHGYVRKVSVS